jgi:hypothetical protein
VTAIVLGTLSSIALIACVYAFIQQGEATKNAALENQYFESAKQCELRAEQMKIEAEHIKIELQKRNEALALELVKLSNSRTK